MQGISTTLSSLNKIPYSNEKESKESRQNISEPRENLLPITALQEQVINHINHNNEKKIRATHDLKNRIDSTNSTAVNGNTEVAVPILTSEDSIERSSTHVIRKRNASFTIDDAGQKRIIDFLNRNGIENTYSSNQSIGKEFLIADLAKYLYKTDSGDETQVKRNKRLARIILANANLYGGVKGEYISPEMAQTVIKEWLFHQVFSSSLEKYISDKMISSKYPSYFTVSSLKFIFDIDEIIKDTRINITDLDPEQTHYFVYMLKDNINNEIPFIERQDGNIQTMSLMGQDFADLYAGFKYVNNMGRLADFSLDEINEIGKGLWNIAFSEGVTIDNVGYFTFPSSIIMVEEENNHSVSGDDSFNSKIASVNKYVQYQRNILSAQNEFIVKLEEFNKARSLWDTKGGLADKVISRCPTSELISTEPYVEISPKNIKRKFKEKSAKEIYLDGLRKPCFGAPENISDEYEKQTRIVSEKFNKMNKSHINMILLSEDKSEIEFISSVGAKIDFVNLSMKTNLSIQGGEVGYYDPNFDIKLKNSELFSVTVNNQERIYSLKREINGSEPVYKFLRVDKDIYKYISNDLLDYDFGHGYKIDGNKVVASDVFNFNFIPQNSIVENSNKGYEYLVNYLNDKHTELFYSSLFKKGDDKSKSQKTWDVVKHFIPFYDCVDSIEKNDVGGAIFSCSIDALSFVPVAKAAAFLGGRFGMGLARGFRLAAKPLMQGSLVGARTTLLRNVILPARSELNALARLSLQAVDPGFELLTKSGKFISNKLTTYLKQETKSVKLAKKLESFGLLKKKTADTTKKTTLARFPNSTIDVSVKKIDTFQGKDIFVQINNDTGDLFGKYYHLSKSGVLDSGVNNVLYQKRKLTKINNEKDIQNMDQYPISMQSNNDGDYIVNIPEVITMQTKFLPPTHITPPHLTLGKKARVDILEQPHLMHQHTYKSDAIIQSVKNNYGRSNIFLCRFNQNIDEVPNEFMNLRENIESYKSSVSLAKKQVTELDRMFDRTMMKNDHGVINYPQNSKIRKYVSDVLDLDKIKNVDVRKAIEREAIEKLMFHTKKIKEYLDCEINNIYFASSHTISNPYVINEKGVMAFVHRDDVFRRIIIMVDNFNVQGGISTQMHLTTLHEASHFSGSLDFHVAPSMSHEGDASEFAESFVNGVYGKQNEHISIDYKFFDAYRQQYPNIPIDENQFREILKRDPMLYANAFMENADFLARMISDLGSGTPFNVELVTRVSREVTPPTFDMRLPLYKLAIKNMRATEKQPVEAAP